MNKEQWLAWLEEQLVISKNLGINWTPGDLVVSIFNIITYDSGISRILAEQIVEVLEAVRDKTTFKYIRSSQEDYIKYITVLNLGTIKQLIEWGSSIRGAWLYLSKQHSFNPGEDLPSFTDTVEHVITCNEEAGDFISAMRKLLEKHPESDYK